MVVDYLDDPDRGYSVGIDPAIVTTRHRFMVRLEHQSMGMYEVYGELLVTITLELMPPLRRIDRNHRERAGGIQNGKPACYRLRHSVPVRTLKQFHRVEGSSELSGPKDDFHFVNRLCYP